MRRASNDNVRITCQKLKKMRKKTYPRRQSRARMIIEDQKETEQQIELYVTVEEQEDREEDDPEEMANVAHYVMMHYAE